MSMMWKQKSREIKDAVLLVAGTGSRLRPLTNNLPKCLIEIAGTPLIVRLLRQLKTNGIERAYLVTGYLSDMLPEHLQGIPGLPELHFVENDAYNTANNAESLRRAMHAMPTTSFLLCDGDILVRDDAWLRELITDPRPNILAVLLQLQSRMGAEEMKVTLEPVDVPWYTRRVVALSKGMAPTTAHGESAGVQVIGADTFERLRERLDSMSDHERKNLYYEDIFATLFDEGHEFYTFALREGTWTEIDTVEDLDHARQLFASGEAMSA